jgi:hypothetical protein
MQLREWAAGVRRLCGDKKPRAASLNQNGRTAPERLIAVAPDQSCDRRGKQLIRS